MIGQLVSPMVRLVFAYKLVIIINLVYSNTQSYHNLTLYWLKKTNGIKLLVQPWVQSARLHYRQQSSPLVHVQMLMLDHWSLVCKGILFTHLSHIYPTSLYTTELSVSAKSKPSQTLLPLTLHQLALLFPALFLQLVRA